MNISHRTYTLCIFDVYMKVKPNFPLPFFDGIVPEGYGNYY
jgi:hypothetical protein